MRVRSRSVVALCGWFAVALALTVLFRSNAAATADYARQTGQPCGTCHTQPEGGGALSARGTAYARGGYQWPIPEGTAAYTPSTAARALKLIVGYVHLTVTVIWFGAIFYIHIAIRPRRLTTGIPKVEGIMGWVSIGIIALTGVALTIFRYLETGSVFTGTFGTVFIIKLLQFGVMVVLAFVATVVLTRRMRQHGHPGETPAFGPIPISPDTLASYDGKEGRKAIVGVGGKLYDVTDSRMWQGGVHLRKHPAGQDLTEALNEAPHGAEVLERVPMIGELGDAPVVAPEPHRTQAKRVFLTFTYVNLALTFGILLCVAWWKWGFAWRASQLAGDERGASALSDTSSDCIACHTSNEFMTAQIAQWERSAHAPENVGCYECHRAEAGDPDAMDHNGYTISVLVTPLDCARCHIQEVGEFAASRHSQAGDILDSLDNILGERVEGVAAAVLGCQQCHGAPVEVMPDGTLSPASWPNTGIGRINPDGSQGACSTCHTRHRFSVAVARDPSSCGNCHLGPDHPQKEIYEESKHGIAFVAYREEMNLEAQSWVLGQDYSAAPTCATCHMAAVPGLPVNHDVGLRIAWTLRPEVSPRMENWEARRELMTQVCRQCHSPGFFTNFFTQFDDAVELYNTKFASPAQEIILRLRQAGKLTDTQFDEEIEWTFFYLWHHEGRRARHGAAMMGPDYVQWNGFFEVADRFYNEFVPQAEALLPGVTHPFLQEEYHQWRTER
jgi:hydroxylamine dehydrogenase